VEIGPATRLTITVEEPTASHEMRWRSWTRGWRRTARRRGSRR
jgi:hypothetical protein